MNNRLELLHVYRAMASVAVVLHHLTAMSERGFGVEYLGGFFTAFEFRVDFFFVLSGFLITWVYGGRIGLPGAGLAFFRRRFLRLYPLLFVLTTLKLFFMLGPAATSGRWSSESLDLATIFGSYFMLPMERYPLILAAWTIPFEVFFYAVFAIAMSTRWRAVFGIALLWMTVIIIHAVLNPTAGGRQTFFLLQLSHLQLMAGVLTALALRSLDLRAWRRPLLAFAILALGALPFIYSDWLQPIALVKRLYLAATFMALIAGSALWEMSRERTLVIPQWLRTLGDSSYSIFLLHSPLLLIGLQQMANWRMMNDGTLTLLALAAVIAGVFCYRWLELPMQRRLAPASAR